MVRQHFKALRFSRAIPSEGVFDFLNRELVPLIKEIRDFLHEGISEVLVSVSSDDDTGTNESAYSGGVLTVPTTDGYTNYHDRLVAASQNCRSEGLARAVNVGSIYCWSKGNVSGNYSARQCIAWTPQSFNAGSEECWVAGGFRGANVGSQFSGCENETNANLAARLCYASGRGSANIASAGCFAGRGGGALLYPVVTDGAIAAVTVDSTFIGANYQVGDAIRFWTRQGNGSGATAEVAAVDVNGAITSISVTAGGSSYEDGLVDCSVDNGFGDWSANVATISECETHGSASANVASSGCIASGDTSGNFATEDSTSSAQGAFNIGSSGNISSGAISGCVGTNLSETTAQGSVAIAARRITNSVARSLAGGNSSSGAASTANVTWRMRSDDGRGEMRLLDLTQSGTSTVPYTVATVPSPSTYSGQLIYVSDGDVGSPCLAWSNGTNWLVVTMGSAVST